MATTTTAIVKLRTVFAAATLLASFGANAATGIIHDKLGRAEAGRAVSSLQVVDFVKTKYAHKGRGVGMHKFPQPNFPDCYIVRLMDHVGKITILKINCQ